ncbi:carbon-nitrogen hydrolase family protein [Jannaschia aquimarina]|uniref:2-oxoglutaramate amidase n=1 Tax=Jannaschia aquimarina TaxID=935700 RepID=A0A0D1EG86_9RHOB|nr:carbon-nitrogen hydrolase family protein [Jannaschia aquimarina]KIT14830.1 2-oxoglutaramate amidase [Jannaschia aquimarina]SNS57094.1 Predicted amidohydrolase [Jannaschia aquimarina]
MRAALLQLTASDDPEANLPRTLAYVDEAAAEGADLILTPEVTNCVSSSREHQKAVLRPEPRDPTLSAMRAAAARHQRWILIGSLALRTADPQGRFANRSILIDPSGAIAARYDKIHMFDVDVSDTETFRESAAYRPGARATVAQTPWGGLGMTVCYDVRFGHLHRMLAQAGAVMLSVPAAFSPVTGAAHWEVLLRARAIETGCFVLAPAQTGQHEASVGRTRRTHGHSMVVAPWGEVLLDAGTHPGVHLCDIDLAEVEAARARVPAIHADRRWDGP